MKEAKVELKLLGGDEPGYNSYLKMELEDEPVIFEAFSAVLNELESAKREWVDSEAAVKFHFNVTKERAAYIHLNMDAISKRLHELTGAVQVNSETRRIHKTNPDAALSSMLGKAFLGNINLN
jgi:hypothetical protein